MLVIFSHIGDFKMYGGYGNFQRFAGRTERAPKARLTLVLNTGRASQVNSLGARAQSCICRTSETRAAAGAREPILAICW